MPISKHITRKQSVFLAFFLIALFFVVGSLYNPSGSGSDASGLIVRQENALPSETTAANSFSSDGEAPATSPAPEDSGEAIVEEAQTDSEAESETPASEGDSQVATELRLDKFQRSETRDGKKQWEIDAEGAVYNPETGSTKVNDATVFLYRENGDVVKLLATYASLALDGASLSTAEMFDGVKVSLNNSLTIESEKAFFNQQTNLVTSPTRVTITDEKMRIEGDTLRANVETQEFLIEGNVKTTLNPDGKGNSSDSPRKNNSSKKSSKKRSRQQKKKQTSSKKKKKSSLK